MPWAQAALPQQRELSMSGLDGIGLLPSRCLCCFFFVPLLSSYFRPQALHYSSWPRKTSLPLPLSRSHCYCFFYLTANLSFKMNHQRLSLQPFNISLLYLFFRSRLNSTTHCITSVFSLRLLILLFVLHFGTYIWHCIQLHDRILLQWTNIWVVSFLFCTPPEIKYSTAFIQSKNGAQGGLL